MIPHATPRILLPFQARHHLARSTASLHSAFPRRPVYFSTTARQLFNPSALHSQQNGSTSDPSVTTAPVESPAKSTEDTEPAPTPTNLGTPPESVACTVSPPATYAFLKPTPVVLLTAPFGGNWCFRDTWQTTLADQGYQSTSIELGMPLEPLDSGDAYIRHFVKVLKTSIETDHSFYPPILIAHGLHALVAQKYVESNPVSALVLVSPFIPQVVKRRFGELSQKLKVEGPEWKAHTVGAEERVHKAMIEDAKVKQDTAESALNRSAAAPAAEMTPSSETHSTQTTQDLPSEFNFITHADVLAQDGFREKYVLPKKAVYKIDQVAKKLQEKEKEQQEQVEKQKQDEALQSMEEETELRKQQSIQTETYSSSSSTTTAAAAPLAGEVNIKTNDTVNSLSSAEEGIEPIKGSEALGRDSVPVFELAPDTVIVTTDADTQADYGLTEAARDDASLPVQTAESEASVPSPLEQLPLAIYDSIPTSAFEPNFPILLVTSNGDEIVSTADVKEHHALAGQVDHIELENMDDGGHLIMVSDSTEWEQGIEGITAWLDSNGM